MHQPRWIDARVFRVDNILAFIEFSGWMTGNPSVIPGKVRVADNPPRIKECLGAASFQRRERLGWPSLL